MFVKPAVVAILSAALLAGCQRGTEDVVIDASPLLVDEPMLNACAGDPGVQQGMVQAVNNARISQQKTLLSVDDRLTTIAQSHACDIVARGRPDVAGSDGTNVVDRARSTGYPTCGVTQFVSVGGSADQVVGRWMVAMAQRDELLAQGAKNIGVGAVRGNDGRMWWSVVLGEDCGAL